MKKLALIGALLATLLLGALPASAGSPVSFTGSGYGTGSLVISGSTGTVTAGGTFNLTAPSTGTGTWTTSFTTPDPVDCSTGLSTTTGNVLTTGFGSNVITWGGSGRICEGDVSGDPVDYYYGGLVTITSATGIYSGYTGSASVLGQITGSNFTFTISGTVTPP